MPEGPAVAGRRALQSGANLVNRTAVALALDRPIGADAGGPAAFAVRERCAGRHHAAFDEQAEGDAWLATLVGDGFHGALVERKGRGDALAGDLHVSGFALDADPFAAEAARHRACRAGAEERVKDDVARLRAGEQD